MGNICQSAAELKIAKAVVLVATGANSVNSSELGYQNAPLFAGVRDPRVL